MKVDARAELAKQLSSSSSSLSQWRAREWRRTAMHADADALAKRGISGSHPPSPCLSGRHRHRHRHGPRSQPMTMSPGGWPQPFFFCPKAPTGH